MNKNVRAALIVGVTLTHIDYPFEANGAAIQGSDGIFGADRTADYPAGKAIDVCYNPGDPSSSRINRGGSCTE